MAILVDVIILPKFLRLRIYSSELDTLTYDMLDTLYSLSIDSTIRDILGILLWTGIGQVIENV